MLRRTAAFIFSVVFLTGSIYLCTAFVEMNLNPQAWPYNTRLIAVVILAVSFWLDFRKSNTPATQPD